ncbi:MAG: hypothetical protein CO108_18475 [Deltaproteobacteria bacterium CG_4_9_14_3_um_filter_63_12]|nr:MAG: hypothetical protein COW42_14630 [Deltaproteobacteria bacterium CG17_big_fil_post_rev_8_21_14_2_50_63_7]PJB38745.1 MAG: hypothetical protein CO108_18475 [Deltaproteobacteria bacterium CG_4_9_14_3_um_filter_63_12]
MFARPFSYHWPSACCQDNWIRVIIYSARDLTEDDKVRLNGDLVAVVQKHQVDGLTNVVGMVRQATQRGEAISA